MAESKRFLFMVGEVHPFISLVTWSQTSLDNYENFGLNKTLHQYTTQHHLVHLTIMASRKTKSKSFMVSKCRSTWLFLARWQSQNVEDLRHSQVPTYDIIINVYKYMIKHDASGFSLVQKNFVKVPLDVTMYVSLPSEYNRCFMVVAQFCITLHWSIR